MSTREPRRPGEADALPRDEALSRAYREQAANRAGPPAALDARVLAAARQAVAAPRRPARPLPWWRRMMVPVSVAALLLVSGTLTLMVHDEQQKLDAPAPAAAPRQAPAALPPTPAAPAAPAAPASVPAQAPLPRPDTAQRDGQPARASREAPVAAPASNRVDAPPAPESKAKAAAKPVEESAAQSRKNEAPPPSEKAAAKPLPQAFPSAAPATPVAPAAAPMMDAANEAATASGAAAGRALAPAKPPGDDERRLRQMREAAPAAPAAAPAAGGPSPGAVSAEPAPRSRDAAERESQPKLRVERGAGLSPEAWLAEIRELKRAGRELEWRESLARWRARYPDLPVPEDLR